MKKIKINRINLNKTTKQKDFYNLELFNLVDSSQISLPVAIVGKGKGKIVTVIAAQHGNEWSGSYVCHKLYERLDASKMNGKVVIIPIANPPAFLQRSRVSSLDHIDMNRTYGFVKKRKPTEHIASVIFENFCLKSDYVFDLHSGGPGKYFPLVESLGRDGLALAKSLNLGHIFIRKKDTSSLVPNCEKHGVKAFSVEAGTALKIDYNYASKMVDGLINFLKEIDILEDDAQTVQKQSIYNSKVIVPAEVSGFFKSNVGLGEKVKKKQRICSITPFFKTRAKNIISPTDGRLIYLRSEEVISEGDSVAHIIR